MTNRSRVVVVTGMSGAGKSTALHSLEDLGYFCVDNLPPALAERTIEVCAEGGVSRVALGIDVRVGAFLDAAEEMLKRLGAQHDLVVLFLDASDEAIIRRFSETRRPHPLATAAREGLATSGPARGALAVLDGVAFERERLALLRGLATLVIDTTGISVHELRRKVIAALGPGKGEEFRMLTRLVSFGFKYGVPTDADLVLDVRLLDNPFFVPELRKLTGEDEAVREFVLKSADAEPFLGRIEELLAWSLPRYEREGKSYLTIAIGCTGGRHRSVTAAIVLGDRLKKRTGLPILVVHRDAVREDNSLMPPARAREGGEAR